MTRFNVSKLVEAAGERAGLAYAHPHMLRHTCGHLLADAGHDTRRLQLWLGHVDIKHAAHYSQLSASPFKEFWKWAMPPRNREELLIELRNQRAFTRVFKDLSRFALIPEEDTDLARFWDAFVEARAEYRRRKEWDQAHENY